MEIRLTTRTRVIHEAGEIVRVSDAEALRLVSLGWAEIPLGADKPIAVMPKPETEETEKPTKAAPKAGKKK